MKKTSTPFFSVIIPTYNRADFVRSTINSLLSQSFDSFEILVIDDGSTDNTEEVISEINDSRLFYYKKGNQERAAARNFGAKRSRGRFVNFFDSDDIAYPNHLKTAYEITTQYPQYEIFHLGYDIKGVKGEILKLVNNLKNPINDQLIYGNHLSCNGVFIKKEIIVAHPFNEDRELSASEDYELWLRLSAKYTFYTINTITSSVINHDNRSVLRINVKSLLTRLEKLKHYILANESNNKLNTSKLLAHLDIYIALHLAMTKQNRYMAVDYLAKSIKKSPEILFTKKVLGVLKNLI